jgi:hypothetical protein
MNSSGGRRLKYIMYFSWQGGGMKRRDEAGANSEHAQGIADDLHA